MTDEYPSQRPMGRFRDEDLGFEGDVPPEATMIPWIDIHQHGHLGSWNDRHQFDLSGGLAVVMVAHNAHFSPYRPMQPTDVHEQWDSTIRRSHAISRSHFFDAYAALSLHTTRTRTEDYEAVLDALPRYAALDEVAAIGEAGIVLNTAQVDDPWTLDEQRRIVAEQMAAARDADLPFICHTPSSMKSAGSPYLRGKTEGGHDLPVSRELDSEDVLTPETAKSDAVEIDVELADEVGLPHEQLVIDHGSAEIVEFMLENTDCYLGFSVGQSVHDLDMATIAETIDDYGPGRIVIDSDMSGVAMNERFGMKEAILDLLRLGVEPADVRTVVYENPRSVLGFDHLPE